MTPSQNLGHLGSLLFAIRPVQIPLLLYYAASNALFRVAGLRVFRESIFQFSFGRFAVVPNTGDLGTIGEIFVQKPYQQNRDYVPKEGDVCIDVGANIGCVTLQWRATNRTGIIVAIEPHPVTFGRMLRNLRLNEVSAVETIQAAVGNQNTQVEMFIDRNNNSMARVAGDQTACITAFADQTAITVPCITIDSLVDSRRFDRIDLLKIDVEGFELECLLGATKSLPKVDRIVLEYHSAELRESCTSLMTSHGFKCETHGSLLFGRNC
jgi:FkbM family methyltransferase